MSLEPRLQIEDTTIGTAGVNADGIRVENAVADLNSVNVIELSGVAITTGESGANGIWLGGSATGDSYHNSTNFQLSASIETQGDAAAGIHFDGLTGNTDNGNMTFYVTNTNVVTAGNNAPGIFMGGVGGTLSGGAFAYGVVNVSVTTIGLNSHAIEIGNMPTGAANPDTPTDLLVSVADLTTTGANSHGLVIGTGWGDSGWGANVNRIVTVTGDISASGAGSSGIVSNSSLEYIIQSGASVSGAEYGLLVQDGAADVTLAGHLSGGNGIAAQFTGADDRFEIQAGGTVTGTIGGGAGTDSFVFSGTGAAGFNMAQVNDFEDFLKTGDSVWTLTGANTDTATFLVDQGTLVNNATLTNMAMTVASGARLEGVGTVGGLIVNGTVAPGNSIGTINVAGNVVFNSGSTYEIEIQAPNLSDLISATGTATINGGDLAITALDTGTSYADGQTYRIIEANGGVIHNADFTHNQPVSLIRTEVIYGADFVDLLLIADIPFTTFAETYNQFQAATGLQDMEQSGDALTVYNEIVQLSLQPNGADAVRRAFDLSSGEVHASGQHVIDQTFGLFARTLRGQASAGLGGGMAGGQVFTAPLGYGPSTPAGPGVVAIDDATTSAYADRRVHNAWLAPLGGRGTIDGDGNAAALDWWAAGLAAGYEGALDVASGNAYAGFGLGYIRSHGSVDARLSSFDSDGFHIGAYGGWSDGPWTLAGSLAYAANRISTERRIVFGGIDRTAEADHWNHTIGFSGEALYGFDMGGGTTISPLFTLDAGWSGHGGFTETGAGALNLTGASESWTRLDTGLGIALQHVVLTESGRVTLDGRAVWEHAFADVVPSQSLAFAGSPTGFTVNGPDAGRDRFRLGAGVSFEATEDLTIRASYSGLFSGSQQNHTASLGLNVKF